MILFFKLPNNYKLPIPILDTQRRLLFTVKVKNLFTTLLNIFENADLNINLREQIEEILIYYQERFNFKEKSLSRKIFGNLKDFYNKMCNYQNWEMKKYLLEEKIQKNIFDLIELSKNPKKGQFLVTKLEEDNKFLDCDYSSITVEKNFPVIKMSLILNMLNIEQIFVSDDGILEGCVIKEDFLKKSLSLG